MGTSQIKCINNRKNDLLLCALRVIYIHDEGDNPQRKKHMKARTLK
nr:MAG TPA: hypothetical protein [Caudoviricetes sp.]